MRQEEHIPRKHWPVSQFVDRGSRCSWNRITHNYPCCFTGPWWRPTGCARQRCLCGFSSALRGVLWLVALDLDVAFARLAKPERCRSRFGGESRFPLSIRGPSGSAAPHGRSNGEDSIRRPTPGRTHGRSEAPVMVQSSPRLTGRFSLRNSAIALNEVPG